MSHRLESRVRKVEEAFAGTGRMQIIAVPATATERECSRLADKAVESGAAQRSDQFVFVRKFSDSGFNACEDS